MIYIRKILSFLLAILFISFLFFFSTHYRIYTVMSGSMEPAISTGSMVVVDLRERKPEVSDIITFQKGTSRITHRIMEISEDGITTKGDANAAEDFSRVQENQIIGTVRLSIPLIGYLIAAGRHPISLCLLAIFILIFLRKGFVYEK
ncbi:MAG: signal peptidase I [Eubacteriales bacterium]|nr:signal peptidase I [Eubacteriales bacterium]